MLGIAEMCTYFPWSCWNLHIPTIKLPPLKHWDITLHDMKKVGITLWPKLSEISGEVYYSQQTKFWKRLKDFQHNARNYKKSSWYRPMVAWSRLFKCLNERCLHIWNVNKNNAWKILTKLTRSFDVWIFKIWG